jgi:hypothetical protein
MTVLLAVNTTVIPWGQRFEALGIAVGFPLVVALLFWLVVSGWHGRGR